jgi:hypothetical protein
MLSQLAPEQVGVTISEQPTHGQTDASDGELTPTEVPERRQLPTPAERVRPLAPERFGLQVTLDQETFDLLQRARALSGHENPKGGIAPVLKRALELLVGHLEKRKFAATPRPRPGARRSATAENSPAAARHIPAAVKRAVWERDEGRCTFISDTGQRCPARSMLEYDHIEPVARGGQATVDGMRLLCRAHNQYAAECTFGSGFMSEKRAEARKHARAPAAAAAPPPHRRVVQIVETPT